MTLLISPTGGTDREVAAGVNSALKGKINSIGTVTLAANVGSTVVTNPLVGPSSLVILFSQTANAAAEIGAGTAYIAPADYVRGTSFKIIHANNAQTDRTFGYVILG